MSLQELKSKVEVVRQSRAGNKKFWWPQDVKEHLIQLINDGVPERQIVKETGIAHQTFRNWTAPKKSKRRKKVLNFEEVTVKSAPDQSILLRWDGGLEISGLNFESLVVLLEKGLL